MKSLLRRIRNLGRDRGTIPPRERERIALEKKRRDAEMERRLRS